MSRVEKAPARPTTFGDIALSLAQQERFVMRGNGNGVTKAA
jgi:hypothetical protein